MYKFNFILFIIKLKIECLVIEIEINYNIREHRSSISSVCKLAQYKF